MATFDLLKASPTFLNLKYADFFYKVQLNQFKYKVG